jgi:hypothetical protein
VNPWSGIVSLIPRPLCLKWKEPTVPVEWGIGGPQSWSGQSAGIPVCCDYKSLSLNLKWLVYESRKIEVI